MREIGTRSATGIRRSAWRTGIAAGRLLALACLGPWIGPEARAAEGVKEVSALFIGNSFTRRNHLADVVERLAEEGNPGLAFRHTEVIYGGRNLRQHWEQFQTQNLLRLPDLKKADLEAACAELERAAAAVTNGTKDASSDAGRYRGAAANHRAWMEMLGSPPRWDYVFLQAWNDKEGGTDSGYAAYARKFAELAHKRGAKVVLYVTAPERQNAEPLAAAPDAAPVAAENRFLASLARELDALVVPVAAAIQRCHERRPAMVFRWKNDMHDNQTTAYLTACMMYAVLFDKSPEGLAMNEVTDDKIVDRRKPDADPDGGPRKVTFDDATRAFLQKAAWETVVEFRKVGR